MRLKDEDKTSEINDEETYDKVKDILAGPTGQAASWVGAYRPATQNSDYEKYAFWNRSHYEIYLKFIEVEMDAPGDVLEIGSASGARSALLARYGNRVVGMDLFEDRIKFAKAHNPHPDITYILGKFPEDAPDRKYDFIFCISVLYQRAAKSSDIIESAKKMLRPKGKLFVYDNNATIEDSCSSWKVVGKFPGGQAVVFQKHQ